MKELFDSLGLAWVNEERTLDLTEAGKRFLGIRTRSKFDSFVAGQILRYRAFVIRERAGGRSARVRAFVVAPRIAKRFLEVLEGVRPIRLEAFEFTIRASAKRRFPPA